MTDKSHEHNDWDRERDGRMADFATPDDAVPTESLAPPLEAAPVQVDDEEVE